MLLRTLGGLALEGSSFRRPKPLLLLAYLAIEGPADRGRLATLFWPGHERPRQNLAVATSQLRAGMPGALTADGERLVAQVDCDVMELVAATTSGDWRRASQSYRGPFLDGYAVNVGAELEEWILDTRDYLGAIVGSSLVEGALDLIETSDLMQALELAERANRLYEAGIEFEPGRLEELHSALSMLGSPRAASVRRAAAELGVELGAAPAQISSERPTSTAAPMLPAKPTSPLIGRERELDEVRTLLKQPGRLVTVTGFGGVGKSRLAIELCHLVLAEEEFERAMFVPMEPVSRQVAALGHVASAVGFTLPSREAALPALGRFLDQAHTLLVLDNMEHLVSWGSVLEELLASTERLVVMTTSTQPLALSDETLFFLEGLEMTPSPDDPETPRCAAVRYFEERARRAVPRFSAESDISEAWRICALVGGLPLGLEMAAGLVRVLSLAELAERLEHRPEEIAAFAASVPERHRSLLSLCEQAWAFLADGERAVLSVLSVFRESFTAADLEAICGPALADLARLERRSLVRRDGARYALHPLIKRFAAERLADDPALEQGARDKHAEHVSLTMQRIKNRTTFGTEGEAARAAERAMPDAIAAWRWSVERGAGENIVHLLPIMRGTLNARGRNALMDDLIVSALDRFDTRSAAAAWLHLMLAQQVIQDDLLKARRHAKLAAVAAAASDDIAAEGLAVLTLAETEEPSNRPESTRPLVRAALRRLREAQSWELVASCYRHLAIRESSVHRHGALLALGLRYLRRNGLLSLSTAVSYHLGAHLTDSCGDHRAALGVALEHLNAVLDGRAAPYAQVDLHSIAAYYYLNAGELDEAVSHNEKATRLTSRRSEVPEPVYWGSEFHWIPWAAPLVALHTAGPEAALREGLDRYDLSEVRDLPVHVMLALGDREGASRTAERWHERAANLPDGRHRIFAQATSERLRATLTVGDEQTSRRHMASALRTCAQHHLVPLALDCVVSGHLLFPDLVAEEEALEAATHPAAYHSAPMFLSGFDGQTLDKVSRPPYSVVEVLRRSDALARQLDAREARTSREPGRAMRHALRART